MSKFVSKKETVVFEGIELKGGDGFCEKIDIHIHFELQVDNQYVNSRRWQAAGNIYHKGKSVGIFRYWLNVKNGRIQPTAYTPLWMPDLKGDGVHGINGLWTGWKKPLIDPQTGEFDQLAQAIWYAVKHYGKKLNAAKQQQKPKTEPVAEPFFLKPVCDWTEENFVSIGVTNRGYLNKILKACEESKPQNLKSLMALKCGFGQKTYEKAVEILKGMGCEREDIANNLF